MWKNDAEKLEDKEQRASWDDQLGGWNKETGNAEENKNERTGRFQLSLSNFFNTELSPS